MTFVESIKSVLTNYAGFTGRASRSEFWWFIIFTMMVSAALSIIQNMAMAASASANGVITIGLTFAAISSLVSLALLLPSLAVGVRRLRDTGRSGWLLLLALIPLVGIIILIVFWAQKSLPDSV